MRRTPARWSVGGVVALVAVASFGVATTPGLSAVAGTELPVEVGDRVLQAVDVTMGPDGSLTLVEGTTVTASSDGGDADSSTDTYAPKDVVDDLPVRVLTSYRTDDGSGTDLAELDGYTGQVAIDLTVQNLTVEPQQVSYDVGGESRTQSALVGAPLTIVASAGLGETPASSVVTTTKGDGPTTNGVLSQSTEGATQVQWASILAPPQLGSSATLTLVVDAEDFVAPSFDLSVQPGLVTDPSLGALVDAAFNPASSDELTLQARTIEVIGEVNEVLGRASDSITTVRTTLEASSQTLGTKTVGDLRGSITSITSSMRSLDGTVQGLGSSLSSTLEATGSSSLQQLQQTVAQVDGLLGDTGARAPEPRVGGQACDASVRVPGAGQSVYANLLQVTATLRGYASATTDCKARLQTEILESIGPKTPDADACRSLVDASSVTCSLFSTEATFDEIADDLAEDGRAAVDALESQPIQDAVDLAGEVDTKVVELRSELGSLLALFPGGGVVDLGAVEARAATLGDQLAVLAGDPGVGSTGALGQVRDAALAQVAVLGAADVRDSVLGQNQALAQEICDRAAAGDLDAALAEDLRSYLVPTSCDGADIAPAGVNGTPMSVRLDSAAGDWGDIARRSDPADPASAVGLPVARLRTSLADLDAAIEAAKSDIYDESPGTILQTLRDLNRQFSAALESSGRLKAVTGTLERRQAEARTTVASALAEASASTREKINDSVEENIRTISDRSARNRQDIGRMFDASRAGLSSSALEIAADGRQTLSGQRGRLRETQQGAEREVSQQIQEGLRTIAAGVSRSTTDTQAAATLLTNDLSKVLLDLGDPQVAGSGLLGSLSANAATAGTADYQLALATRATTAYANVRSQDIAGIRLRQAQAEASFRRQAALPAFQVEVPQGVEHRTVYSFHLLGGQ